jgi:hypothetical protein
MRDAEACGWMMQNPWVAPRRALRVAVTVMGIGLVMMAGAARAQDDDEDDDKTFEEKIIEGIMSGIGGTNMENKGIDYRERSPLVVPPKLNLPPPQAAKAEINQPNWPKDPDAQRRKAAIAARQKSKPTPEQSARPLSAAELNAGRTSASARTAPDQPGNLSGNPMLSPSQLGYNGGLMGMFGGNKAESAPFTGEPTRETLTQPPTGYQTPSPNFAYGTGPKDSLAGKHIDIMTGKEVSN